MSKGGTAHPDYENEMKNYRIKLFVDDVRDAPGMEWNVVRTFHDAISFLEKHHVYEVSLDHDLGCFYGDREMTGRDILNWLVARKVANKDHPYPAIVRVHSANVAVVDAMKGMIEKYWGDPDELAERRRKIEESIQKTPLKYLPQ